MKSLPHDRMPPELQPSIQVLRAVLERFRYLGEDEADSHLAWQGEKALQRLVEVFASGWNGNGTSSEPL
jgi:hypothetical protein